MTTKIVTLYLPQFHEVKENNEWWGEGFTEWTSVRNSKPLFEGHDQPRTPLNENYYDLLNKETLLWQADLMKKYGIYGQCFYHYYFEKGRMILEKPAENLLKWTNIEMPFCFSWANLSWVRSWSNIKSGSSWVNEHNKKNNNKEDGMLLRQDYGRRDDWIKHFDYLLPFFKDERYIKKEGKPVFLIYRPSVIDCLDEMIECWRLLANQNGLLGIYFIGTNECNKVLDAEMYSEPQTSIRRFFSCKAGGEHPVIIDGEELSRHIINRRISESTYYCGTPGYDESPRRGRNACVTKGLTPDVFYKQMQSIISISNRTNKEYVFINAWNEWGEGMYLEPDTKYGYQYLEAISNAIKDSGKEAILDEKDDAVMDEEFIAREEKENRHRGYWTVLDKWMHILESGRDISEFFKSRGYRKIAVYGYGMLGKHFINQIKNSEIEVEYVIDAKAGENEDGINVISPDDEFKKVDAVVICVTYDQDNIYKLLNEKIDFPIVNIESIVEGLLS